MPNSKAEARTAEAPASADPQRNEDKRANQVSTIAFPYGDLNEAMNLARAIAENGGAYGCEPASVAAWLGTTIASGTFRAKIATARVFGLLQTGHLQIVLTDLGKRIVDPPQEVAARAEAFLSVPLYHAVYEKTKGFPLPSNVGVEALMESLGVSPKQKDKARWAFQRSADQAGFFAHGKNRLVAPFTGSPVAIAAGTPIKSAPSDASNYPGFAALDEGIPPLDPILRGLILRIPQAGSMWTSEKRRQWLSTAEHIFSLVFVDEPMSEH